MKRYLLLFSLSLGLAVSHGTAAEPPQGNLLELHSCELYAGGCVVSGEATQAGRYMLSVWDITDGTFDGSDLAGLQIAVLQVASANLAAPDAKADSAVAYLPESASPTQREALLAWLKSSQPEIAKGKIQLRVVPLTLAKQDSDYTFSAGKFISVNTKPLQKCDTGSCGEALWYEPRAATSIFTVAVNRDSQVAEPLLKLHWTDSGRRSVFLGHFGGPSAGKDVFVSLAEVCGSPDHLF